MHQQPIPVAYASVPVNLQDVTARVERRLAAGPWDQPPETTLPVPDSVDAAAEVAAFAMGLSGRQRLARRDPRGRFRRLIAHFALAAALAISTVASTACDILSDSGPAAIDVDQLSRLNGTEASVTSPVGPGPALYQDLVLLDPGGATTAAMLVPLASLQGGRETATTVPVLAMAEDSAMTQVGGVYRVPAFPVPVGTRDGQAQFLDVVAPAQTSTSTFSGDASAIKTRLAERWQTDERFAASTRSIEKRPTVMDAAYNAAAAAEAGGIYSYTDGVVLRVDPDAPVLQVADRALVESGKAVSDQDIVFVAIRPNERSIYAPGDAINLRDVAVNREQTTEGGTTETFYIVNAAINNARVEPAGKVDLQSILQKRLERTDADLSIQSQELAAMEAGAAPQATPAPTAGAAQQTTRTVYRGPSYVDDMLIFWWLTRPSYYSGSNTTVSGPPPSTTRPQGDFYYVPPARTTATDAPTTTTAARSTALQAARNAVSGQAAGTGGGVAATNKAASDSTARVSAASAKAASVASTVSASSVGKSVAVAPSNSSSSAARSAGNTTTRSTSSSIKSSSSSSGFGGIGSTGSSS
jgi:hypothetical protein